MGDPVQSMQSFLTARCFFMRSSWVIALTLVASALAPSCVIGNFTVDAGSGGTNGNTGGTGGDGLGGNGGDPGTCKPLVPAKGLIAQVAQGVGPYTLGLPAGAALPDGGHATGRGFTATVDGNELTLDAPSTFWGWDELTVPIDDGCTGTVDLKVRLRISPTAGGKLEDGADATLSLDAGPISLGSADVDGDGTPDLLIGTPEFDADKGRVAVIFGGARLNGALDLDDLGNAQLRGFAIVGQIGDELGTAVAGAGDITCSDRDSMLLGAPGNSTAYLVDATGAGDIDLAAADGQVFVMSGNGTSMRTGAAVAGGLDVNGDAIPDLLIGSPNYSTPNAVGGLATVVFGGFQGCNCESSSTCRTSGQDLTDLNGSSDDLSGFAIGNALTGRQVGQNVALLGAVAGNDALADVGLASTTSFLLVPGQSGTTAVDVQAGALELDTGSSVRSARAGDFDGDEVLDYAYCLTSGGSLCHVKRGSNAPDISFSEFDAPPGVAFGGRLNSGTRDDLILWAGDTAWIVFGKTSSGTTQIGFLGSSGYTLEGGSGASLSAWGLGDLDDDGFDDVAIADSTLGRIYIVKGGP